MIESKDNQKLKLVRKLFSASGSKKADCFVVEGERAVLDCLRHNADISFILVREDYKGVLPDFTYETVAAPLFAGLSDTESPQGILAVCKKSEHSLSTLPKGPLLYTDGVRDPGNLGTLIRSADAFGFKGVLLSPDSVSVYNPKVIRSTMSSLFHLPIIENVSLEKLLAFKNDYSLFGGVLNAEAKSLYEVRFPQNSIVVVGNEANGISSELVTALDFCVYIPMNGKAESLNVGVAGGILMYTVQKDVMS